MRHVSSAAPQRLPLRIIHLILVLPNANSSARVSENVNSRRRGVTRANTANAACSPQAWHETARSVRHSGASKRNGNHNLESSWVLRTRCERDAHTGRARAARISKREACFLFSPSFILFAIRGKPPRRTTLLRQMGMLHFGNEFLARGIPLPFSSPTAAILQSA